MFSIIKEMESKMPMGTPNKRPQKPPNFISFATDTTAAVEIEFDRARVRIQKKTRDGEIINLSWGTEDAASLRKLNTWIYKAVRHLETR